MEKFNGFTNGGKKIGFVSTRFAGTDGVSLESEKWVSVLEEEGSECFYMAGELERPEDKSFFVEHAHFYHPDILAIQNGCFGVHERSHDITILINSVKEILKDKLYEFVEKFNLDLLIVENALAIPVNIPLGLALTEYIVETRMPVIAHHHDFFWERKRFFVNAAGDYLRMAFPPKLPSIHHVVINTSADEQLGLRTGISSMVIPNVMDFETPPPGIDDYSADARESLGVKKDEKFILQPTRVVQRKGIEHSIEFVKRLKLKAKLVISHASGDEGNAYENRLREYSALMRVDTLFVSECIKEHRGITPDGRKVYNIWDVYPHADLVTYPSNFEGFGNAFLEAVYFRKPLVVNRYSVYETDIMPRGFEMIEMDDFVTTDAVGRARLILKDKTRAKEIADRNYLLAKKYFSFSVLRQKLNTLLIDCFSG